jgi:hypothetical protein
MGSTAPPSDPFYARARAAVIETVDAGTGV